MVSRCRREICCSLLVRWKSNIGLTESGVIMCRMARFEAFLIAKLFSFTLSILQSPNVVNELVRIVNAFSSIFQRAFSMGPVARIFSLADCCATRALFYFVKKSGLEQCSQKNANQWKNLKRALIGSKLNTRCQICHRARFNRSTKHSLVRMLVPNCLQLVRSDSLRRY